MQASKFIATDPILTICITHKHYQPTEMTLGLILQYTSHSRHDAMTTTPSRAPEFPLKCTAIVCVCACLCICVSKHVRKIEMAWFEITTLLQFHHKNDTHTHTYGKRTLCNRHTLTYKQTCAHTETFAGDKRVSWEGKKEIISLFPSNNRQYISAERAKEIKNKRKNLIQYENSVKVDETTKLRYTSSMLWCYTPTQPQPWYMHFSNSNRK